MQADGMCVLLAVILVMILLSSNMRDGVPNFLGLSKKSCGCDSAVCGGDASQGSAKSDVASARVVQNNTVNTPKATLPPKPSASAHADIQPAMTSDKDGFLINAEEIKKGINKAATGAVNFSEHMEPTMAGKLGGRTGCLHTVLSFAGKTPERTSPGVQPLFGGTGMAPRSETRA